jgi:hypothetical protein
MDYKTDYKTDYIARLFQKTSHKRIENYCITRLWHKLDNPDIKLVPQQYVGRHDDKYALTDVFLPQFGLHVEINEPAHYDSPERINADKIRKQEIESQSGHKVVEIDCRGTISEIQSRVDDIVKHINDLVTKGKENGTFQKWDPDTEFNALHWNQKGHISVTDNVSAWNVEEICKIFGADFGKTKRGFLRRGGIQHPKNSDYVIWWPTSPERNSWINEVSENDTTITETHKDDYTRRQHYQNHKDSTQKRIVFLHRKDILGLTSYKFIGVFEYNRALSSEAKGVVWSRCREEVSIVNP